MKQALLSLMLFASALPLFSATAQTGTADEPITSTTSMRLVEEKEVLAASSALLAASVDLRADGSARTTHQIGKFSTRIELMGLSVSKIEKTAPSAAEQQQGIARRYIAHLTCKAHRIWDAPMVSWSEWRKNAYGFFPSTVVVEEIDGALVARATRINDFSPGIDATMTAAR